MRRYRFNMRKTRRSRLFALYLLPLAVLILSSCARFPNSAEPSEPPAPTAGPVQATPEPPVPSPTSAAATSPPHAAGAASPPALVTGTFEYTNDFIFTYYVENAVGLIDMYGFVRRDPAWRLPIESQSLGFLNLDAAGKRGAFRLQLPVQPQGTLIDVDNNDRQDAGVQIFAVSWWPNLVDGPFWEREENDVGWPTYLASTVNDSENNDEVTGGRLIIWSPDARQQFPTGFGSDGRLFTADDPVAPIPSGYALVDLDKQPFALSQETELRVTLYEPVDAAIKDYANLGYGEAFQKMFDQVRQEYAFNDVPGKAPDWDELYRRVSAKVADAEQRRSQRDFYLAVKEFTNAFQDGHVGMSGQAGGEIFRAANAGGFGMAARELDDGRVIVVYLLPGGPAETAGIRLGAELRMLNGTPIKDAIAAVVPFDGPYSTEHHRRYEQVHYLLRAPIDSSAKVAFVNPSQSERTVDLRATGEFRSFLATSLFGGSTDTDLPVEFRTLESGVGYIKITSFYDDLNLLVRLYERALHTFQQDNVPGVIIDLRQNGGGSAPPLAGYLTNNVIELGQRQYYSSKTGKFEPDGAPRRVEPATRQYRFDKLALLVGPACASACEAAAYSFSQVPGMAVVGQYPTAGMYGDVARGQFRLPDGISLQVPTGRNVLPDGSVFLEGAGVAPTQRVPVDQTTALSSDDVVLQAAEEAILGR